MWWTYVSQRRLITCGQLWSLVLLRQALRKDSRLTNKIVVTKSISLTFRIPRTALSTLCRTRAFNMKVTARKEIWSKQCYLLVLKIIDCCFTCRIMWYEADLMLPLRISVLAPSDSILVVIFMEEVIKLYQNRITNTLYNLMTG